MTSFLFTCILRKYWSVHIKRVYIFQVSFILFFENSIQNASKYLCLSYAPCQFLWLVSIAPADSKKFGYIDTAIINDALHKVESNFIGFGQQWEPLGETLVCHVDLTL